MTSSTLLVDEACKSQAPENSYKLLDTPFDSLLSAPAAGKRAIQMGIMQGRLPAEISTFDAPRLALRIGKSLIEWEITSNSQGACDDAHPCSHEESRTAEAKVGIRLKWQ